MNLLPTAELIRIPDRRQLSERLRDAITEGFYLPGDKLTERELCERFTASRASVREAIRQLDGEGLLEVALHRGPAVKSVDVDQFVELHEVRVSLQKLAAASFARKGEPAQMEVFEARIDEFERALTSRDIPSIRSAKHQMMEAFLAGAHNEPLAVFIRQINARLGFLWASSLNHPARPAESIEEFRRLSDAIRERDAEAAQAVIVLQAQRVRAIGLHALELFRARRAQG